MEFDKLIIKSYKCFDDDGVTIETIKPINVIIGKNNSGKSSVIDVFKFLTLNDNSFQNNRRRGKSPELEFEHVLKQDLIKQSFPDNVSRGDIPGTSHQQFGLTLVNSLIKYSISGKGENIFKSIDKDVPPGALNYLKNYVSLIKSHFKGKLFSHLSAERDIQPEQSSGNLKVSTNGVGATNLIQTIINRDKFDSNLIEKILLDKLNKIVKPDINFTRILVQQDENSNWEIYFESEDDGRVPLSKMGSLHQK
jgi:AAA15 family ATPase/GTPase